MTDKPIDKCLFCKKELTTHWVQAKVDCSSEWTSLCYSCYNKGRRLYRYVRHMAKNETDQPASISMEHFGERQ